MKQGVLAHEIGHLRGRYSVLRMQQARSLPLEVEHWRGRRDSGGQLYCQNREHLSHGMGQPFHREVASDGNLAGHEQLPEMSRGALVRLLCCPESGDVNDHDGKGSQRHEHGDERARFPEQGKGMGPGHGIE